jgi:hypothetical protein
MHEARAAEEEVTDLQPPNYGPVGFVNHRFSVCISNGTESLWSPPPTYPVPEERYADLLDYAAACRDEYDRTHVPAASAVVIENRLGANLWWWEAERR